MNDCCKYNLKNNSFLESILLFNGFLPNDFDNFWKKRSSVQDVTFSQKKDLNQVNTSIYYLIRIFQNEKSCFKELL